MKIKMNKTRTVSYKYDWCMIGATYDVDNMPDEVAKYVPKWLKDGSAIKVADDVKAIAVKVNHDSLELERKQAEERENAYNLVTRTIPKSKGRQKQTQEE